MKRQKKPGGVDEDLWDILRRHLRLKQIDNGSRFSQKTVQKAFMKKQRDIELVSKTVTLEMLMLVIFSESTTVSSTNKSVHHDKTEILVKVVKTTLTCFNIMFTIQCFL
jgi:hypothetical protein